MTMLIDPPHHEARAPTRGMQTNNHIGPTPYGRGSDPFARTIRAERRTDHGRDHDAAPIAAGR